MVFGLRNAAQTFQRFMHIVLRNLDFCYVVYINDLLVASSNIDEHKLHLQQIFERLWYYGVVLNVDKCVFAKHKVTFLGHTIASAGVEPLNEKVATIRGIREPQTVHDLRRFLGMISVSTGNLFPTQRNCRFPYMLYIQATKSATKHQSAGPRKLERLSKIANPPWLTLGCLLSLIQHFRWP